MKNSHDEEVMELSHDIWPGFRKAFYITFAPAIIYLIIILVISFK